MGDDASKGDDDDRGAIRIKNKKVWSAIGIRLSTAEDKICVQLYACTRDKNNNLI